MIKEHKHMQKEKFHRRFSHPTKKSEENIIVVCVIPCFDCRALSPSHLFFLNKGVS